MGSYWYIADGQQVHHTNTLTSPTFTSAVIHNGEAATTVQSITSDGFNVYAALGTNGVHTTTRGAATSTHYSDLQASLVAYVKGRLMAARNNSIYNITASGAAPAALFTQNNTDFTWVGFAEGRNALYMAGYSGDRSIIYRTSLKTDGTALDAPVVAGELPDGEIVRSIQGYLGTYIIIGTDRGVRFAQIIGGVDAADITIGGLIRTPSAVRCFEPQDRYVWFGYERYDSVSSGLGRLDLSVLNESIPAYASDLMVTAQADVTSVGTYSNKRIFAISGTGFYKESDDKVSTGSLETGYVTYGLADYKTLATVTARHVTTNGTYRIYVSKDDAGYSLIGTHTAGATEPESFPLAQTAGERFEMKFELDRSPTTLTAGPSLRGWTLRAKPAAKRNVSFTVPLLLFDHYEKNGQDFISDPSVALGAIESVFEEQRAVSFQLGTEAFTVFLDDYEWIADHQTVDRKGWSGTAIVRMSTIE